MLIDFVPTIKSTSKVRKYQKHNIPVLDVACDLMLVVGHGRRHIVAVQLGEVSPVEQRDHVPGLQHPHILPGEGVGLLAPELHHPEVLRHVPGHRQGLHCLQVRHGAAAHHILVRGTSTRGVLVWVLGTSHLGVKVLLSCAR